AYVQTDEAFNQQSIEDLVSLLFWRWQWALMRNDPARLSAYATSALVDSLGKDRRFYQDPAVGSVTLVDVGPKDEQFDQARVRVKWSGWQSGDEKLGPPRYEKSTP